jgi:hypothetical protein
MHTNWEMLLSYLQDTNQSLKQEGHDGPKVAHLYIAPNPLPPQRCRANLTQELLFAQTR